MMSRVSINAFAKSAASSWPSELDRRSTRLKIYLWRPSASLCQVFERTIRLRALTRPPLQQLLHAAAMCHLLPPVCTPVCTLACRPAHLLAASPPGRAAAANNRRLSTPPQPKYTQPRALPPAHLLAASPSAPRSPSVLAHSLASIMPLLFASNTWGGGTRQCCGTML